MEDSCRRALEIGLPAVAFTEHADFTDYVLAQDGMLDVDGYLECVEDCRRRFPGLRILSGVELGEPHRFAAQAAAVRSRGRLDRVLGSVHCIERNGVLVDVSTPGLMEEMGPGALVRRHLQETLRLLQGDRDFEVLAHLDYPKRYWPAGAAPFDPGDYEEEVRAVLREAAAQGRVLEVNTTRGMDPARGLCPGAPVLAWWAELGGAAVSLGSDAHSPDNLARGFDLAAEVIAAAGFRRPKEPTAFWTR